MKSLDEIKGRLAKATPGPWYVRGGLTDEESGRPGGIPPEVIATDLDGYESLVCAPDNRPLEDAELIAHAPTDLSKLIQALEVANAALADFSNVHGTLDGFRCMDIKDQSCKARAEIQRILGD